MNWTYTDSTEEVVYRVNADDSIESYLIIAPNIQAWLAQGNTPLPPS